MVLSTVWNGIDTSSTSGKSASTLTGSSLPHQIEMRDTSQEFGPRRRNC
jgi:hypothetical protein